MRKYSQNRTLQAVVESDLKNKMVLLSGPRQCGKTTLAKNIAKGKADNFYSWDIEKDRKVLLSHNFNLNSKLWVFDELHKYRRWKNWLKGVYDEYADNKQILVTGSARLNVFKKGGDSLQGRYFFQRLFPFTLAELASSNFPDSFEDFLSFLKAPLDAKLPPDNLLADLLKLGSFPEPFLSGSENSAKRWTSNYGQRLVQEDLQQLHQVRELAKIELLFDRLPEVITSSITTKRLAFDLEVAFESVKFWLEIFDNLYATFRVLPYGLPRVQAVKKQHKLFLWDYSRIEEPGPRLENLVALHLLRLITWAEDVWGEKLELRYYRDQQQHEIDFLILKKRQPFIAIEVKSSEQELDRGLNYFLGKAKVPYNFQLHLKGKKEYLTKANNGNKVWIMSLERFLMGLV